MRVEPSTFERAYAASGDPWDFATSVYERRRYDAVESLLRPLAGSGARPYRRCFEPACSVGVLTERLAARCDEVVAVDPSPSAIAAARTRLAGNDRVQLAVGAIPEWWPDGEFDLIVFAELGYYWDRAGLADLLVRLGALRAPGGDVVAVHWLGKSTDHLLHGFDVHAALIDALGAPAAQLDDPGFVAAVWR
ncbi:MAG: SAM-dependent methyltransferase [Ilumatobacteraceae bacterium]